MHECNAHVYVSTQCVYLNYGMLHPSPLKTKLRPRSSRSSPYWEMERNLTNLIHNGTLLPTASTIKDISCSEFILRSSINGYQLRSISYSDCSVVFSDLLPCSCRDSDFKLLNDLISYPKIEDVCDVSIRLPRMVTMVPSID